MTYYYENNYDKIFTISNELTILYPMIIVNIIFFRIFQILLYLLSFLFQREILLPNGVASPKITLICVLFSQRLQQFERYRTISIHQPFHV